MNTLHIPAPTLRAHAVSKSYISGRMRTPVLENFSLSIDSGALTLISGPSGCGKSTLLTILSGLQSVDAGQVHALGDELGQLDKPGLERFRLQHTGFVFQDFSLFPALTAREQVELPLHYLGMSRIQAQERAQHALDEVGLTSHRHLRPAELSGGEKQRVALARAIAKKPQLLFADEPTSALDAANGQVIIDILHGIARNHGTTVLCVSHDARLIRHADRVLYLEDGRILQDSQAPSTTASPDRTP
jgi:putative ABC transport system ATP-binding protein